VIAFTNLVAQWPEYPTITELERIRFGPVHLNERTMTMDMDNLLLTDDRNRVKHMLSMTWPLTDVNPPYEKPKYLDSQRQRRIGAQHE
jgi:hypothetical protein